MGKITVNNLGKAYKTYPTKLARLKEWLLPFSQPRHTLKWILQDISFQVEPGESLGIIGINGAGKSTLLKMLTGTTKPTTGSVSIEGKVAALLELGMGFHPDFTGRQNALMAGQLLGYSVEEITQLMPEIESFAEIGEYIDQPVRVYSSGMQMRLAFSVATAQRPDVLIVDEALSVGDAHFQHKSFDRIRQFSKAGTTLLIVSHDKQAIQSICNRAILLNAGQIAMEGEPEDVMDYYNAILAKDQNQEVHQHKAPEGKLRTNSGTLEAEITSVNILNAKNETINIVSVGEWITVQIDVKVNTDIQGLVLGCGIKDRLGLMVFGTNTHHTEQAIKSANAGEFIRFNVYFAANLGVGSFSVSCSLVKSQSHLEKNYHWIDRATIFEVINTNKPQFVGYAWNNMKFDIVRENATQ